jgi:hypothetical protein
MWNSRANDSYLFLLFQFEGNKRLKAVQPSVKEKMVGRFYIPFFSVLFGGTIGDNG